MQSRKLASSYISRPVRQGMDRVPATPSRTRLRTREVATSMRRKTPTLRTKENDRYSSWGRVRALPFGILEFESGVCDNGHNTQLKPTTVIWNGTISIGRYSFRHCSGTGSTLPGEEKSPFCQRGCTWRSRCYIGHSRRLGV